MLTNLLLFELKLQTRQVGFWVTCLILFLFGLVLTGTDFFSLGTDGGERIKTNGAISIANSIAIISELTLFFAAVFTITGVMRDEEHNFLEIVHSTSVKTFDMAISRMIGVFAVTFLCVFVSVLGMWAGQLLPSADNEAFGAFYPLFYLQPVILFMGINAFLVSTIYMAVAAITRSKPLVYVSAVALFMLTNVIGIFLGENSPDLIASLVDPFGTAPLQIITEYWTPVEQNENLMPLFSLIGLNRLVWSGFALVTFATTLAMFKRGMVNARRRRSINELETQTQPVKLHPATPRLNIYADITAFFERFKLEYLIIVKSVPFLLLALIAFALFTTQIYYSIVYQADPTLPTSTSMIMIVMGSFGFSMLIITIFFASDIMWRERIVNLHEILDATPVKNAVLITSKLAALFGVILTLLALGIIVGMIAQVILGDIPINPWTYLKVALVAFALNMFFSATAIMMLQNFMPNRVIGMLIAAALFAGFSFLPFVPFYHPLMNFGTGVHPGAYSEINGFNRLTSMGGWSAYWGGLIMLFLVLTIWLLRRGTQTSLISRFKGMRAQTGVVTSVMAALGLASFVGFGGLIYKRLNIDQQYINDKAYEKRMVKYEREMKPLTQLALPKIRRVDVNVNFNPSAQKATVSGRYNIENVTGTPLETLYISLASDYSEDILVLDVAGASTDFSAADADQLADYQLRRFTFNPPLPTGGFTTIDFETYFRPPRLGDNGAILKNGTFVNNSQVMPQLGVPKHFMRNPDKRRKYDLPKRERRPDREDLDARNVGFFGPAADFVDFKATLCTDPDQIAIAPGTRLRSYIKDGQACADFEANRPILNFFSFSSQKFEQERAIWKSENGASVDVVINYHQAHNYNVSLMMKAAKASLDIFTEAYGPYQYEQLRILEFPYRSFAQAFAGTIPFSENIGFVQNSGDPEDQSRVDLATYVTMHEIAHQWFGHQIVPAEVKGFNVLSEGLAENAAMTAYEQMLGWGKARRALKRLAIQDYLTGRTFDPENELPLATQERKYYQDYAKASWVFWGLRHTVGVEKINGAMKKLIADYGSKGPPYPTTIQTYNVSFDINIDKRVTPEDGGKEVSVTELNDVTLDELIEVGFYTEDPTEALGGGWFAKERVRLNKQKSSISFNLDKRPTHVLLDPQRLLLERNEKDNLKKIESN